MSRQSDQDIRQAVRDKYTEVASAEQSGCGCSPSSCCGDQNDTGAAEISRSLGYAADELAAVPDEANMGLGCGNPQTIASLQPGETVLDLGSGGGLDCFLAAQQVGDTGYVIGVDMTPAMVTKARTLAEQSDIRQVEFRLGELEHLPVADASVDVIISNCVINLSPAKDAVFSEAFRVLKPGGRLAISDIVALAELPEQLQQDMEHYTACISGAATISTLEALLRDAGFEDVQITPESASAEFITEWAPGSEVEQYVASATMHGVKPQR